MATQHPVFIRKLGNKTVLTTIIDTETLNDFPEGDSFAIALTDGSMFPGTVTICLDAKQAVAAEEYIREATGEEGGARGKSINGVLRAPWWFIKKTKTLLDQLAG